MLDCYSKNKSELFIQLISLFIYEQAIKLLNQKNYDKRTLTLPPHSPFDLTSYAKKFMARIFYYYLFNYCRYIIENLRSSLC